MEDDYKHTRNLFKDKVRRMDYNELLNQYNDLNIEILKARNLSSTNQNPYQAGRFPVKLLKWKRGLIIQEMLKKKVKK
jgi:hypothetical protein